MQTVRFFFVIIVLSIILNISPLNKVSNKEQGTGEVLSGHCATGPSSQVELYCHSATCVDIKWNEMSCLKGPWCYMNTSQVTFIYIAPLTIQIVTKHCTISK